MREVSAFTVVLALMLALASLSEGRRRPDGEIVTEGEVTFARIDRDDVEGIDLFTATQTVSMSWRKIGDRPPFPWFTLTRGERTDRFTGDRAAVDRLLSSLSSFRALRSLGELSPEEAANVSLSPPTRHLRVKTRRGEQVFEIGREIHGGPDHPVRIPGAKQAYLVAGPVLEGLVDAPGPYMVRKLIDVPLSEITEIELSGAGASRTFLHVDPASEEDGRWTLEGGERATVFENFLPKMEAMTLVVYTDRPKVPPANPILRVSLRRDGREEATLDLWREEGRYYAVSTATQVSVELVPAPVDVVVADLPLVLDAPAEVADTQIQIAH